MSSPPAPPPPEAEPSAPLPGAEGDSDASSAAGEPSATPVDEPDATAGHPGAREHAEPDPGPAPGGNGAAPLLATAPRPPALGMRALVPPQEELARWFVGLSLLTILVGRALAPALPGTRTGIERWIDLTQQAGVYLTQFLFLAGLLASVRILFVLLRLRGVSLVFRLLAVPLCSAQLTVTMGASRLTLQPSVALIAATTATLLALAGGSVAVRQPRSRAPGLVLLLAGSFSLLEIIARLLALLASERALHTTFQAARVLASVGSLLDLAALGVAAMWLLSPRPTRGALLGSGLVLAAAGLAWLGASGSYADASTGAVLVGRMLGELTHGSLPLLSTPLRYALEALALLLAGCCLFARRKEPALAGGVALALMARGATDVPLCGLLLLLSALCIVLASSPGRPNAVISLLPTLGPTPPPGHTARGS